MKVVVDFAPGLHGHFLELVLNKYIFGVQINSDCIFQSSGAVHAINVNDEYQQHKIVNSGHFSSFNTRYPWDTEKVVFINHCSEMDIVLLTNIYYRCHPESIKVTDFNVEEISALHQKFMAVGTEVELRNNWFAKLDERHFEHASMMPSTDLPVIHFDFTKFFDLPNFCNELKKVSKFLNKTFKFDPSLGILWQEFIKRNQGLALYHQGNNLLENMLTAQDCPIPNDWKLHSYLNFRLSRMFDLYDGLLYNSKTYPATTLELLDVVQEHLVNFDNRW